MEIITMRLKRPLTDLMPEDVIVLILYTSCLFMAPGSALINLVMFSVFQRYFRIFRASNTARLLPGLYMNLDKESSFSIIVDRYEELKSKKKEKEASIDEKKELKQIKKTIAEISPRARYELANYYPNFWMGAAVFFYSIYRLYILFPQPMKQLFGEGIISQLLK